jgi:thiol-disulfide isomerase/thioredoxin
MCNAQKMVRDNGLIFGRNDAQKYTKEVGNSPINNRAIRILPPKHFGPRTLQTLLNSNILFKNKGKESSWIQGWSMKDYWELTSWPRDVAGAANVRFGFPVVDDLVALFNEDDDESKNKPEEMILAPPLRANGQAPKAPKDKFAGKDNPFIFNIKSVGDLSSEILGPKKKCVLFLSSTSCRTCKYLTPQYTKLSKDFQDKDVVFAKVNAFSKKGKELSRVLEVDAVPAFVMFRDGKRFGTTMSLTRIPSKKLNLALELLTSGDEWDAKSINKLK